MRGGRGADGDGTVLDEYATSSTRERRWETRNPRHHRRLMAGARFEQTPGPGPPPNDAVVVGYDLPAIDKFLAVEFDLLGIPVTGLPACAHCRRAAPT